MIKERLRFNPRMTIFDIKDGKEITVEEFSLDGKIYYECYSLSSNILIAYLEDPSTKIVVNDPYMVEMIIERS